jgi:stage V sporulation protein S
LIPHAIVDVPYPAVIILRTQTPPCGPHQIHARGGTVEVLKVSSKSNPNSVAGALAGIVREQGSVEIQTVGAGALNQAIKAVAIARGFIAPSGIELTCVPAFADIEINGEERTAIRLLIEQRDMRH